MNSQLRQEDEVSTEHELSRHGRVVGESYRDACERLAGQLRAAETDLARAQSQRGAVLALHQRRDTDGRAACGHCSIVGRRGDVPVQLAVTLWPCPTVQALGGAA